MGLSLEQCEDPGVCFATEAAKQAWADQNQCGFGDDADGLGNDLTEDGTDGPGNGSPRTCSAPDNSLFPGANQNDSFFNSSTVQASGSTLEIAPRNGLSDAGASVQTGISATHVGNPIHVVTGNKYQAEKDIDLPGLNFVRHYNSLSTFRGPFGNNWRHGFDVRFVDRGNKVYLWQADGRRIDFSLTGYGEDAERHMAPVQHGDGELVISGEQYLWRWENGTELLLLDKKGGRLAKVTNTSGPELLLEYDPQWRLTGVREQIKAHHNSDQRAKQTSKDLDSYTRNEVIRQIAFSYNDNGKLAEVKVVGGQHVYYDYDSSGRLNRVRYDDGAERLYHYENDAFPYHLTGISSGFGESDAVASGNKGKTTRISTWAYDEKGRAISSARQGRARQNVTLEYGDGETLVTDQDGMTSRYVTSMIGGVPHVTKVAGPGCGPCQRGDNEYLYRGGFQLVTDTTESDVLSTQGDRSRIERDSVNPDGKHVLEITRNKQGLPVTVTETGWSPVEIGKYHEIARTTQYKWDMGRLVERDGPLENGPKGTPEDSDITQYHYNDKGWLIRKTLPKGLTESFEYDQAGRVITSRKKDGIVSTMEYDVRGRLASLSRAGQTITLTYDYQGKIDTIKNLLGQSFLLEHDVSGDLVAITDQEGQRITWEYGLDGRVNQKSIFDADGTLSLNKSTDKKDLAELFTNDYRSEIVQNRNNKISIRFDSQGRITSYHYDDFGRLIRTRSPVTGTTSYRYDVTDNRTMTRYSDGSEIQKKYDVAGRLIRRSSESEVVELEWDDNGRLSLVRHETDGHAIYTESFRYNSIGKLSLHKRIFDDAEFETGYQYDRFGRLEIKMLPGGEVLQYRYHDGNHPKAGSLSAVERKGTFGNKSLITGINRAGEAINDREFEYFNELSQRSAIDIDGNVTFAGGEKVAFSNINWRKGKSGVQFNSAVSVQASLNTEEIGTDPSPNSTLSIVPFSNPVYEKTYNPDVEYHYPAETTPHDERGFLRKSLEMIGLVSNFTAPDGDGPEGQPVNWSSANYNQRGELINDGRHHYQRDVFGRLIAVYKEESSGARALVANYKYNFFGERISKTVYANPEDNHFDQNSGVTTLFLYDGNKLVAEATKTGIQRQFLYLGNRPVLMNQGNEYYPIHTDHRYAPLAVTDKKQRVIWQAGVGDNGASHTREGAWLAMPLRGSNQYHDAETGLHYNTHRYLDPAIGRYLSPDPKGLEVGLDLHLFALGQPHRFVDLDGRAPAVGQRNSLREDSMPYGLVKPAEQVGTNYSTQDLWAASNVQSTSGGVVLDAIGQLLMPNSQNWKEEALIYAAYGNYEPRCADDVLGPDKIDASYWSDDLKAYEFLVLKNSIDAVIRLTAASKSGEATVSIMEELGEAAVDALKLHKGAETVIKIGALAQKGANHLFMEFTIKMLIEQDPFGNIERIVKGVFSDYGISTLDQAIKIENLDLDFSMVYEILGVIQGELTQEALALQDGYYRSYRERFERVEEATMRLHSEGKDAAKESLSELYATETIYYLEKIRELEIIANGKVIPARRVADQAIRDYDDYNKDSIESGGYDPEVLELVVARMDEAINVSGDTERNAKYASSVETKATALLEKEGVVFSNNDPVSIQFDEWLPMTDRQIIRNEMKAHYLDLVGLIYGSSALLIFEGEE
nr:DUF6531 domain-containing protein [Alcanivorax sp. S6407]